MVTSSLTLIDKISVFFPLCRVNVFQIRILFHVNEPNQIEPKETNETILYKNL